MKKRIFAVLIMAVLSMVFVGCGKSKDVVHIGVSQLLKHEALDAAYDGFVDALADAGYVDGENIKIDHHNAQGDQSNTNTIANKLVTDNNDLILAIGTPAAQAAANATKDIPILISAITDPAKSGLVESNELPNTNVSGASDLTPVKKQIELLNQLLPDAKSIAILYSSSEDNSKIQAALAQDAAKEYNIETMEATVSNLNEIQQVIESLVGKVDAIYVPTDNDMASGMPTISMIATQNNIPIITGEEGPVKNGGLATYGIDYYKLGRITGEQAVQIIEGKAEISKMPIAYLPEEECAFAFNEEVAKQLGIEIPSELKELMED